MQEYPKIDVVKVSKEVKDYLDRKKMDLIDWGCSTIECYPDPKDPSTPELNKFASMWEEFFDYADSLPIDNDGNGFPNEIAKRYEALQQQVEDDVNKDDVYWNKLRSEVLPLYAPPDDVVTKKALREKLAGWQNRWNGISLFYDPIGLDVTTTKISPDRKDRQIINKKTIPPGFVIRVK